MVEKNVPVFREDPFLGAWRPLVVGENAFPEHVKFIKDKRLVPVRIYGVEPSIDSNISVQGESSLAQGVLKISQVSNEPWGNPANIKPKAIGGRRGPGRYRSFESQT